MKRKPYIPSKAMGRVIAIGFFYSHTGPKKDVIRVEVDLRDAPFKERKKIINYLQKLEVMTGAEK